MHTLTIEGLLSCRVLQLRGIYRSYAFFYFNGSCKAAFVNANLNAYPCYILHSYRIPQAGNGSKSRKHIIRERDTTEARTATASSHAAQLAITRLPSRLHIPPPVPREPRAVDMRRLAHCLVREPRVRALVAAVVVEDAACDDAEVFGEVEGCSDYEEREEEEEY